MAAPCLVLVLCGCSHKSAYSCESSIQCVQSGTQGVCEPEGFCAFPDPSCPSGERYEPNAGGGLAGMCVTDQPADAPAIDSRPIDASIDAPALSCGAVGMGCCATGNACVGNAFCASGMCKQCIVDITAGANHTCAIRYDGTVWCAGQNDHGQLGTGVIGGSNQLMRQQVRDNGGNLISDATAIHAGVAHNCVLRANGTVWCWGKNDDGQLGTGLTAANIGAATPATRASDLTALTGFVALTTTHDATCAIDNTGGVSCWGDNASGQLGDGTQTTRARAAPVLVAAGGAAVTGVAAISGMDDDHVCLRTTANAIDCWGFNTGGQVGDNTIVLKTTPVHVFDGLDVAAGRGHTCAIKADNTVWCWGNAGRGRLGIGPNQPDAHVAVATVAQNGTAFGNAAQIVAGGVSCARTTNGDAYCWGTNAHGQTGTGVGTYNPMPVIYADGTQLRGVVRMVVGYADTCAFLADGELLCWGKNAEGQLGDGTTASRNNPGPVPLTCP